MSMLARNRVAVGPADERRDAFMFRLWDQLSTKCDLSEG
jgi:hypothetical protein